MNKTHEKFYITMKHFFPEFSSWLKQIKDPRKQKKTDYSLPTILWTGIFLFLFKLEARRQIKFELDTDCLKEGIKGIIKEKKIPHGDTVEYSAKRIDPEEVHREIRHKMIFRLIRMKCFDKWRLLGKYILVSIDGTGIWSFPERHCEHCLTMKKKDGSIIYYHNVLEAKITLPFGMVLSMESEFIENPGKNPHKQDCELKAFYRLAEKLKKRFPRLKICLLVDSLYANGPVFNLCKKYGWRYIINFKDGALPSVVEEIVGLRPLQGNNYREYPLKEKKKKILQKYWWVTDIDYQGHRLNVLDCIETEEGEEPRHFTWITDLDIDWHSCLEIANNGGRLRWKIENEGFNSQKNGGYNLEHVYSENYNSGKVYYLLLQIAHNIHQLMEKDGLLKDGVKKCFGSIKNFTRRLLESFKYVPIDWEKLEVELSKPIQIRFDDS